MRMLTKLAPQFLAKNFEIDVFEKELYINKPRETVFRFFCSTTTFVKFQLPPYRAEFTSPHPDKTNIFETGVQTLHHGPLMCFAGIIGEIKLPQYRDLQYYYGSYVISLRLVRPLRFEMWFEEVNTHRTLIKFKINWQVRKGFKSVWKLLQNIFFFQFSMGIKFLNIFGLIR